jgi:hypothetical protein
MVFSVSLWYLFSTLVSEFICFLSSHILYFSCLRFSWVPPVCFDWPRLLTSPWNSQWLLAGYLLSECFCGLCWVPCHGLSLSCWSLELGMFSSFPYESCIKLFLVGAWFPSIFCLPITPLGAISVPGLCVV